jgi:hypothetical protein
MFRFIGLCLGTLVRLWRPGRSLLLENLALRQQLAVLKRRHPRPRLDLLDKLFWVAVRRFWFGWQRSLIVVTPETVVRWHRAGFRLYWKFALGELTRKIVPIVAVCAGVSFTGLTRSQTSGGLDFPHPFPKAVCELA